MQLMTTGASAPTMTSREIAELTGKEHFHVLRDIHAMLDELQIPEKGYIQNWIHPQNGQSYTQFALPKDLSITLVAGYSAAVRYRIVKRWQELEAGAPRLPGTFAEALRLAAEQAEQIEQQQAALAIAAPKAEFVERYVGSNGSKGFREVAKLLKANEREFRDFLIARGIMYRLGGALMPKGQHMEAGRFEVKTGASDDGHAFNQAKFTPKGVTWIAGEWAKHQLEGEA